MEHQIEAIGVLWWGQGQGTVDEGNQVLEGVLGGLWRRCRHLLLLEAERRVRSMDVEGRQGSRLSQTTWGADVCYGGRKADCCRQRQWLMTRVRAVGCVCAEWQRSGVTATATATTAIRLPGDLVSRSLASVCAQSS